GCSQCGNEASPIAPGFAGVYLIYLHIAGKMCFLGLVFIKCPRSICQRLAACGIILHLPAGYVNNAKLVKFAGERGANSLKRARPVYRAVRFVKFPLAGISCGYTGKVNMLAMSYDHRSRNRNRYLLVFVGTACNNSEGANNH